MEDIQIFLMCPTVFIMKLGLIQTRPTWQTCKKPPGHKHNLENSKAHLWQFQSYWFLEANLRKPIFCYVEQSLLLLQSILSEWVPLVPWKLLRRLSAKVLIIFLKRGSMTLETVLSIYKLKIFRTKSGSSDISHFQETKYSFSFDQ